jgi:hypothetical protein
MDLGGEGVSVYAEAKSEYTTQLCQYLVPSIQQYFLDLLEEAKQKEAEPKRVLMMFQTLLEGISEWNTDKVQRETTHIATKSRCDYLDELMTAVFIAHTKVLSAIRLTTKQKKLQITIPKLEHFLHRTLTECARLLWSNTYLFSSSAPTIERQKNLRQIETILQDGILQAIRGMLPVKNILREYLRDEGEDEDEGEAEEAEAEAEPEAKEPEAEAKEEPKKEEPEEETKEEENTTASEVEQSGATAAEIVIDISAADVAVEKQVSDVSGDKAPTTPVFTGADTAFATEVVEEAPLDELVDSNSEDIKIMDSPPEPMDGFEDLENKDGEILAMDFEEL